LAELAVLESTRANKTPLDESVTGPSGAQYRVRAYTFWDGEPWESDLYIKVFVHPRSGHRRWWRYKATGFKGDEEDLPPG
jgi:hypothetical protein